MDKLSFVDSCLGQQNQLPLTVEDLVAFLEKNGQHVEKCFMTWAKKSGISDSDARNAFQDTLTDVLKRIKAGDARQRHIDLPMLITSAKRQAVRNHKSSKAVLPAVQTADGVPYRLRHDPKEVYQAMRAALPTALENLGEEDLELLLFCDVQKNTQQDAAKRLGVCQGTISRRLGEARRQLQQSIIANLLREGFDRSELPVIPF